MRQPVPWLWLYRPTVPSARAQAIQVMCMAHAMASRGHPVTLAVDPSAPGVRAEDALAWFGLAPVAPLRVVVLPRGRTAASIAYRGLVLAWIARHGRRGVIYARHARYAASALRLGARVVWEAHEVDSVQDAEAGRDPAPARALERALIRGVAGIVCNAPGTLDVLRGAHGALPRAVALPNGTGITPTAGAGEGVGYVGSVRAWKDLDTLAAAAARLAQSVTIVGADPDSAEARALVAQSGGHLRVRPAVPYREVSATLGGFAALALPLGRGVLPEQLSSPLKLADYLASGRPVVAADLSSTRAIAGDAVRYYAPGDPASLAAALALALGDPPRRPSVRTWSQRAAEVEAFVAGLP